LRRRRRIFGARSGDDRERQNCQNQPQIARRDEIDGHAVFLLAEPNKTLPSVTLRKRAFSGANLRSGSKLRQIGARQRVLDSDLDKDGQGRIDDHAQTRAISAHEPAIP
jgi:hypothetical protein